MHEIRVQTIHGFRCANWRFALAMICPCCFAVLVHFWHTVCILIFTFYCYSIFVICVCMWFSKLLWLAVCVYIQLCASFYSLFMHMYIIHNPTICILLLSLLSQAVSISLFPFLSLMCYIYTYFPCIHDKDQDT